MINIKVMKEIEKKSQEAVQNMTMLQAARKRNMKLDVDMVIRAMEDYDYLCEEIKKLINED